MNLLHLFSIQEQLDQSIIEKHHLHNQDLLSPKILALQVEVAELANETRCFKYWSLKKPSSKEVIVEEYVDGLHFILSLGLSQQYEQQLAVSMGPCQEDQTTMFRQLFGKIVAFDQQREFSTYQELVQTFLDLGVVLGFTWADIEQAYLDKNKVNHQRQAEGY